MTYQEKLKHPKWQKKRLEIMNRDSFQCVLCGDMNNHLNVHHLKYTFKEPWNYDNKDLITICDKCHKEIHETEEKLTLNDINNNSFWPPIKMSDGTIRKGPNAEIIGTYTIK